MHCRTLQWTALLDLSDCYVAVIVEILYVEPMFGDALVCILVFGLYCAIANDQSQVRRLRVLKRMFE